MIGQLVRRLREEKGFTQEELAALSRLSAGYISKLERGIFKQPSPAALQRLAAALGAQLSQFYLEAGLNKLGKQEELEEGDPTYRLYIHQISDLPRHDREIISAVLRELIDEERAYEQQAREEESGE